MRAEDKYFNTLNQEELWQRYCGFLELSIDEFMETQNELLMDEIERVAESTLGKEIIGKKKPKSVEDFRRTVPLTTYEDYEPYLSEKREDVLAEKPVYWCHSSGRGGKFKWLPFTSQNIDKTIQRILGTMILAGARRRGEVQLRPGRRVLLNMAPRPYGSGYVYYHLSQRFTLHPMPPQELEERMEFQERIMYGFKMAMREGMDEVLSIASVLVKMGERMAEQATGMKPSLAMLHPAVLFRVARAKIRARMEHRPMLPKDLWDLKALIAVGADAKIYKEKLEYYWGQEPYEVYGATEIIPIAVNSWNKKWLTLVHDMGFWEFIPLAEREKEQAKTVLTSELEPGQTYELVMTQFYGMPLLRYRVGDLITVVDLKDEEAGINLPQIVFKSSIGGLIDLAGGLARLDERTVWQAIADSQIKYEEWSARKEYDQDQTYLRLYMELKESREPGEAGQLIDRQLKDIDVDYRDIGDQLSMQPVRVTLLAPGTFQGYQEEKRKEGADLAHLKPPHMNASDAIIERLLAISLERSK
jgi:hypothetical protein